MKAGKRDKTPKIQVDKFREVAREMETASPKEHFDTLVKRVVGPKPRDEAVARAGKGAVMRSTKLLKHTQMKPKGR